MRRINPYNKFHGSYVPEWLMEREEISPGAKLCYARLVRFSGKDGKCYPKRDKIAQGIGVSERQVDRYIRELKNADLIDVHQSGLGKTNDYIFYEHEWMLGYYKEEPDMSIQESTDVSSPMSTDVSSQESTDVSSPNIRESYKESQVYNNHIHQFEEFWDLYGKKVERRKCEKKWKKLSKDDVDAIMQFVPIYKESVSSKQYQKNPFTFLNSRIWEDDWDNYKPHKDERPITASRSPNGRMESAYQQFVELFGDTD